MIKKIAPLSLAMMLIMPTAVMASNTIILDESTQTSLSITAYNNNLGLIQDIRKVPSQTSKSNLIEFQNVSPGINSRSALLEGVGRVIEQNFDSEILSIQTLLEHNIGKQVNVSELPFFDTHEQMVTILNVTGANAIIQTQSGNIISIPLNDRDMISRFGFTSIPETLRIKPTLSMMVEGELKPEVSLTYLTSGISWTTDYVANVSGNTLDLNAWVTLSNNTGIGYKDANIRLIAGSVNTERPRHEQIGVMRAMALESSAPDMQAENVADYKLYRVPFKVDLLNNQEKQISLFTANAVPIQKEYRASISLHNRNFKGLKPNVTIVMNNAPEDNLGLPMPSGTIRFYEQNAGERFFIGESRTTDVAINDVVRSTIGQAFDITIEGRMTDININRSSNSGTLTHEYEINNASDEIKTVLFDVSGWQSMRTLSITENGKPVSNDVISGNRQNSPNLEIVVKLMPNEKKTFSVEYSVR